MTDSASLLRQLDELIARGCDESRLRALWHATDVLISGQYSEQDIWTFGEVIERLARGIEAVARAELARRLAHSGNAPFNCVRQLARDASIEIAGPILRHSARLDVQTLVAIARSEKPAASSRDIQAGDRHRAGDRRPRRHRQSGHHSIRWPRMPARVSRSSASCE